MIFSQVSVPGVMHVGSAKFSARHEKLVHKCEIYLKFSTTAVTRVGRYNMFLDENEN